MIYDNIIFFVEKIECEYEYKLEYSTYRCKMIITESDTLSLDHLHAAVVHYG